MVIRPDMAAGDPDDIHLPGIFFKPIVALTPEQAARKDHRPGSCGWRSRNIKQHAWLRCVTADPPFT
jgi:hypothetical protein